MNTQEIEQIAQRLIPYVDPDALWDYEQIAEYLGVSPGTVKNMSKKLPKPCFTGKRKRWVAKEIKAWAKRNR